MKNQHTKENPNKKNFYSSNLDWQSEFYASPTFSIKKMS